MPSSKQIAARRPLWQRLGQSVRGPFIGLLLGVLFARLGYKERGEFHYFMNRVAITEEARLGVYKPGIRSGDVSEKLAKEEPKLADEPTIRVVTLYGVEVGAEYAGLGLPARPGRSWFLLPSHCRWRLQLLFGAFGGLLGFAVAQQRAINDLRRQMGGVQRKLFPAENDKPDLNALFPRTDRPGRPDDTLPSDAPASPS